MVVSKNSLPLFITKSIYIFPGFVSEIAVAQKQFGAVEVSKENFDSQILVVSERSVFKDERVAFFDVGVLCTIKVVRKLKNTILVSFKSQQRIKVVSSFEKGGVLHAKYDQLVDQKLTSEEKTKLVDLIVKILKQTKPKLIEIKPEHVLQGNVVSDFFSLILQKYPDNENNWKQRALEMDNLFKRYKFISSYIKFEPLKTLNLSKLIDQSINNRVKTRLSRQQREFFLREKLRAIREELGETDPRVKEINQYFRKLEVQPFPEHVKKRLSEELERYQSLPPASGEAGLIKGYIDWLIDIPWYQKTEDMTDLKNSKKILDKNHFGLKEAKERIIEHLAANLFSKKATGQTICLVGPPGTGKTSLGFSIAKAMGKKYVRISLGGVKDEAEIRGHRRTYLGSMPGKLIQALKRVGTVNPVVVIDEIDKLSSDFRGDPASAMLEVLDPGQNQSFVDHYIEEVYDLSKVMFIATANYEWAIPAPLHDRMEIINLSSYTEIEKMKIAKEHLFPLVIKELGLKRTQVTFQENAFKEIIKFYTREAGVRELKRLINKICQKIIVKILSKENLTFQIDAKNVSSFLGKRIFEFTKKNKKSEVGLVTGLAYTEFGGEILPIETTMFKGKGDLILTGKLGEVMKESANIAYDYIKSNVSLFGIDFKHFVSNDFHIHVPGGAIPKDGPSAGITITTALISLLKKSQVSNNLAMTGEITLRGNILQIGGLKEKLIAAVRSGIKTVFIPKSNKKDLGEIPSEIRKVLKVHLVKSYEDVYQFLFGKKT